MFKNDRSPLANRGDHACGFDTSLSAAQSDARGAPGSERDAGGGGLQPRRGRRDAGDDQAGASVTDDRAFASVYELILRGIVVTGLCVLVACWLGVA